MAAFIPPKVSLDPTEGLGIRTLPALVDFHGENNPQHLFCLQVKRDNRFVPVSYERLQHAIVRCQVWLEEQAIGLHPPIVDTDGHVKKCAPIAILMESHVGLAIYVLACMGMGVPVVLLSARLSAPAVRHLIRETGAKLILISPRLQPLASEAFPAGEDGTKEADEERNGVTIRLVVEYETLLEEGGLHIQVDPLHVLRIQPISFLKKTARCSSSTLRGHQGCRSQYLAPIGISWVTQHVTASPPTK